MVSILAILGIPKSTSLHLRGCLHHVFQACQRYKGGFIAQCILRRAHRPLCSRYMPKTGLLSYAGLNASACLSFLFLLYKKAYSRLGILLVYPSYVLEKRDVKSLQHVWNWCGFLHAVDSANPLQKTGSGSDHCERIPNMLPL